MHPLDSWIAELDSLEFDGVEAWHAPDPCSVAKPDADPETIILNRLLWHPTRARIREFIWDCNVDCFLNWERRRVSESDRRARRPWIATYRELAEGCHHALVRRPRVLFGMSFLWDDTPCSSSDGFFVQTISDKFAVIGQASEESSLWPIALGLVDAKDPIRSTALLLNVAAERSDWFAEDDYPPRIGFGGLRDIDAFRLLMARDCLGDSSVITMEEEELREYRGYGEEVEGPGEEGRVVRDPPFVRFCNRIRRPARTEGR